MEPIVSWREAKEKFLTADKNLNQFFEDLREGKVLNPNGVKLTYRDSQEIFSLIVMKAIREREILLIEAGVGTGKSFGYLLPIFHTMDSFPVFDKILISTSSIGLQEQLVGDVKTVSELLDIPIKVEISKGMNNYACLRNIEKAMDSADKNKKEKDFYTLSDAKKIVRDNKIIDKALIPLNLNTLWDRIQVNGRCDNCEYKGTCEYVAKEKRISEANIVITNHTQLANMTKNASEVLKKSSMIVVDEAHKLEEEIRLSTERKFEVLSIWRKIQSIVYSLQSIESYDFFYEIDSLNNMIKFNKDENPAVELIRELRKNGKAVFNNNNIGSIGIKDAEKISVNLNSKPIKTAIENFLTRYGKFKEIVKTLPELPEIKKEVNSVLESIRLVEDMNEGTNSKNLYWIKFRDSQSDDIELLYSKKNISDSLESLYTDKKSILLTSATLETNGNYEKITSDLSLNNNDRVVIEDAISSPFDYDTNSLFYYDTTIKKPLTKDAIKEVGIENKESYRNAYILELALRIRDLIEITQGKALVLFTSKADMMETYNIVKALLPNASLILQNDKNVTKWKEEFEADTDSSLFATGAFWEGIDIKGKTLSNVIITRLPFPVMDPITEYKMSINQSKNSQVFTSEMLIKLKQGTGRLIRDVTDTGIVCSLDARTKDYLEEIKKTLPFTKYTTSLDEVLEFSEKNIIGNSSKPKILTLEEK